MNAIEPLRKNWKINEDQGFVHDQIRERVRSEDNYTHCKGYPIIKNEEVKGRAGKPIINVF